LEGHQASRRDRNRRLVHSLQSHGVDITLDEVQAMGGSMTGRPHFARILVQKGYVRNTQEAFDRYLADTAQAYVDRHEPQLAEAVEVIARTGGLPVLAHPIRLVHDHDTFARLLDEMVEMGLAGLETYYSDHDPEATAMYLQFANQRDLAVTGGSDFHGTTKPGILLGFGKNHNLNISRSVFEALERY
jgi:predicted metal-dependent phosphoesterase TrpH